MAESKAAAAAAPAKDAGGAARARDAGAAPGKGATAPATKQRNLKPLIISAIALLLLAGAAGAAYYLIGNSGTPEPATAHNGKDKAAKGKDGQKGKDKDAKEETKRPYFVEFETFTVNLKDPEKFLQIKLTFQVKSVEAAEAIKELMPIVRSAVIPVLSAQDPADLMAKEGKEKLSSEVVAAANKSIAATAAADSIDAVLITHMLIQ